MTRVIGSLDEPKRDDINLQATKLANKIVKEEFRRKSQLAEAIGWTPGKVTRILKHSLTKEATCQRMFYYKHYRVLRDTEDALLLEKVILQRENQRAGMLKSELRLLEILADTVGKRSAVVKRVEREILMPGETWAEMSASDKREAIELLYAQV
jgi:hypothetical protein